MLGDIGIHNKIRLEGSRTALGRSFSQVCSSMLFHIHSVNSGADHACSHHYIHSLVVVAAAVGDPGGGEGVPGQGGAAAAAAAAAAIATIFIQRTL